MKINRSNYEAYFLDYLEGNLAEELRAEFDVFLLENPDLADELNDVRNTMDGVEHTLSISSDESFNFKSELKKSETLSVSPLIEDLLIKELEGDLTVDEKNLLLELESKNANVPHVRFIYSKTKLTSSAISFNEKSELIWPDGIDLKAMPYALIAKVEGELNRTEESQLQNLIDSNPVLKSELLLFEKTKLQPQNIVFENKESLRKKEAVVISMRRVLYAVSSAAAVIALIVWFNWNQPVNEIQIAKNTERNPEVINSYGQTNNSTIQPSDSVSPNIFPQNRVITNDPINQIPNQDIAHNDKYKIPVNNNDKNETPENQNEIPLQQNPVQQIQQIIEPENNDVAVVPITPDMTPVHNQNLINQPGNESKSQTVLSLIGERVEKGIENSYAYGLVERKAEKLGSTSKNAEGKIVYERTSINADTDQLVFKFLGIKYEREVAKKVENKKPGKSRFSKLEKKYQALISH